MAQWYAVRVIGVQRGAQRNGERLKYIMYAEFAANSAGRAPRPLSWLTYDVQPVTPVHSNRASKKKAIAT